MSVDIFKYRDWVLEVERAQTETLYKGVSLSGSESCDCGNCKHFLSIKHFLYPDEVKGLFDNLGMDINKEFEVCDFGDEESGHFYSWWFHFIGEIIEGKDCNTPLPTGGYTMDLLPINDILSIGFTKNISISFFDNKQDLIQVELWLKCHGSNNN